MLQTPDDFAEIALTDDDPSHLTDGPAYAAALEARRMIEIAVFWVFGASGVNRPADGGPRQRRDGMIADLDTAVRIGSNLGAQAQCHHLRAKADAQERGFLPQGKLHQADLGPHEVVLVVGAHRAAQDHRAGVAGQRLGQWVAVAGAANIEPVAAREQQLADVARRRVLLMQDDQHGFAGDLGRAAKLVRATRLVRAVAACQTFPAGGTPVDAIVQPLPSTIRRPSSAYCTNGLRCLRRILAASTSALYLSLSVTIPVATSYSSHHSAVSFAPPARLVAAITAGRSSGGTSTAETRQLRVDFERQISPEFDVFAHVRYLDLEWDFNGLFPGSGVGNAGLTTAVNYLTPGPNSPINGMLTAGLVAFPSTVSFGLKDLTTGVVTPSTNTAALNALNGNGLMQQTWLNHDQQEGTDFGSNFGGRWEHDGGGYSNSLTAGLMYYDVTRSQNQSATSHVINDVRSDSHIYDVVALDASNNVIGTLTNNGVVSYGEWGVGINTTDNQSLSVYANDELRIGENLHIDFGVRHENLEVTRRDGNGAAVNQPVPLGTAGLAQTVGATWDGTYTTREANWERTAWTIGANYLIWPELAVYARYSEGFQTLNIDEPVDIVLYEAGVRYQSERLSASATIFRTEFDNQFYGFIDPINPAIQGAFLADLSTDGFEISVNYSPTDNFVIEAVGVFQNPELSNVFINNVATPSFEGNRPERTPETLFTITPRFLFGNGFGEIYGRYKFVGDIFADAGNGLALPEYGVTSVGIILDPTERLRLTLNADNIFDEIGLTEGNPRQGQTQNASSGFFYGRGIVGTTYTASATLKF